jgi:protocatechuate 3,4-dioxygenase beta subunit
METARRQLLRRAGAIAALTPLAPAWPASACEPAPQCRKACGPTGRATEGPFYVANTPDAVDINPARMPGAAMHIGGTVYGADGVTPVAGAKVEIWHADSDGRYHPEDNGDIARYRRSQINLRGSVHTDAQGRYAFDSIVPGHYGDRRRHLHWKVSAAGHRALTTQSYWLDERGTPRDKGDGTDSRAEACRWVDFTARDGVVHGVFDIVLIAA